VSRASGKFGVTLRRTSSKLSDVAAPKEDALDAIKPQVVAPSAPPASEMPAEEVVNVKQLELMVTDFFYFCCWVIDFLTGYLSFIGLNF